MTHATIDQLSATLRASMTHKLKALARPLADYTEAVCNLAAVGVETESLTISKAVTQTIGNFLRELEASLTQDYAGNGTVKASFKGERYTTPSFYRSEMDINHLFRNIDNLNYGFQAFLDSYPFRALAESALKQTSTLEARGLEAAADRLSSRLHLVDHQMGTTPTVKTRRDRLITYARFDSLFIRGYSYSDWDCLYTLARDLEVVEAEMGDFGAAAAVNECADALRSADDRFDSRTKLLEGRPVDFVVFKNHLDIRIRFDFADTVLAFLALHGTRPIVQLTLAA